MAKWTAANLPDMTGRTVLITGAGSGIGLIAARELGRVGAHVVLGVRSVEKGCRAIAGMSGDFEVRHLDVADLGSVRRFAQAWTGDLDVLVGPSHRTQGGQIRPGRNHGGGPVAGDRQADGRRRMNHLEAAGS